jgi:signal transduction histidine kinase
MLAATYVLLVVTIGLEVPLAVTVSKRETRNEERNVLTMAALLAARINDDLPTASENPNRASDPRRSIAILARITKSHTGLDYLVVDQDGRVIADTSGRLRVGTPVPGTERGVFDRTINGLPGGQIEVAEPPGQDRMLVTVPVVHFRAAIGAVQATESLAGVRSRVHRTWFGYAAIGAMAMLVGLAATWVLAGTLVRPVRELEEAAVRLGSGDLEARAEPSGPAEIATLAGSFNQMASTLSANITAQNDFLANASHQLRTPLTGLRLRLEAIQGEGGFAGEQATKAEGEVDRLAELVEDLLVLARASSVESTGVAVDLTTSGRDAVDRWTSTAEAEGKHLSMLDGAPPSVWADPRDVEHVLDNLIENAIRYTEPGSTVVVGTGSRDGVTFVSVSDDGPGILSEDRDRIFERFYRGSVGRQSGPGTGLGLAIVRELARRWGGDIQLRDGTGTTFEVSFPTGSPLGRQTPAADPGRPAVS